MAYTIDKTKLAALIAAANARRKASMPSLQDSSTVTVETKEESTELQTQDRFGNLITYNEKQKEFVELATSGKSAILIGAAGTGKTTCMRGTIESLIQSGKVGLMSGHGHKYLPTKEVPGIVIVAFTRRAVNNIRKNMPEDMKDNCITIHKLLEFEPVYYEVEDPNTGETKKTMRFEPARHAGRPLPEGIKTIVVEESSMVSVDLQNKLQDALGHNVQWIYLGDIQQLPPVFGSAILGYKMLELPTVELTEVYRQALESPIIRLAHRILSGVPIKKEELPEWKANGLTLHPWSKRVHPDIATLTLAKFFTAALEKGEYDPEEDMILIPFNKSCGTDELNKHIANYLARKNGQVTWEIIAGYNKHYFSIGDKILYDKEDAIITDIIRNPSYFGKQPQKESATLDYWGHDPQIKAATQETEEAIDFMLEAAANGVDEDKVNICSHRIKVSICDSDREFWIDRAADVNTLILSYALTVHKSQGSEWRKVFLTLHQSHATMLQRELLYTAVTRAKEELYVICEPDAFINGIKSQRIKGNTLAEKAEYFKGKMESNGGELK